MKFNFIIQKNIFLVPLLYTLEMIKRLHYLSSVRQSLIEHTMSYTIYCLCNGVLGYLLLAFTCLPDDLILIDNMRETIIAIDNIS